MAHKLKLAEFREHLRKDQLAVRFHQKRILLLQQLLEPSSTIPQQTLDLPALRHLAAQAQHQQNLQKLHHQKYSTQIWPFMSRHYHNTEQQLYASSCLCNIFIIPQQDSPTREQTHLLLDIMSSGNMKIINNVLVLLFNLMYDHPPWRDHLVQDCNLVSVMTKLFEMEGSSEQFLLNLLKTIIKSISKCPAHHSFLLLTEPLLQLIQSSVSLNQQLTYTCLSIVRKLLSMYYEDVAPKVVESRVIVKLAPLVNFFTSMQLAGLFLDITALLSEKIKRQDFKTYILPMVRDKIIKNDELKIKACNLLYNCLQDCIFSPFQLWLDPMSQKMLTQFEHTDKKELLTEYCHIFSICLLNIKLQQVEADQLRYCLSRAKQIMSDDIELQGVIEQTLIMHEQL